MLMIAIAVSPIFVSYETSSLEINRAVVMARNLVITSRQKPGQRIFINTVIGFYKWVFPGLFLDLFISSTDWLKIWKWG